MKVSPIVSKAILRVFIIFFICFLCINILFSLLYSLRSKFAEYLLHIQLTEYITDVNFVKSSMFFSVLSGLILIYLVNHTYINTKIKELCSKWFSLPAINTDINMSIPVSAPINVILFLLSGLLIFLFFRQYFSFEPMIHPETYGTFPLQIKKGTDVIKQCIPTIFNLDNFEGGAYRPRLMSFLIDYININALPILNRLFPFWGMRLIFNVIAILLSIFAVYLLLNNFFKAMPVGLKLFLSVFPIYFVNTQSSMGIFYRTSKFLVIPLCLFLLHYFLKYFKISYDTK